MFLSFEIAHEFKLPDHSMLFTFSYIRTTLSYTISAYINQGILLEYRIVNDYRFKYKLNDRFTRHFCDLLLIHRRRQFTLRRPTNASKLTIAQKRHCMHI